VGRRCPLILISFFSILGEGEEGGEKDDAKTAVMGKTKERKKTH